MQLDENLAKGQREDKSVSLASVPLFDTTKQIFSPCLVESTVLVIGDLFTLSAPRGNIVGSWLTAL
jgi:hypothetical protein